MYIDHKHHSEREFLNGIWQVDLETGMCCQPLIFWYLDRDKKAGLGSFTFDCLIFTFSKWGAMPWDNWKLESVTSDFEPAGDYSDDFESVTGEIEEEEHRCEVCGTILEKRRHARTCSPKCRKALSRMNSAA